MAISLRYLLKPKRETNAKGCKKTYFVVIEPLIIAPVLSLIFHYALQPVEPALQVHDNGRDFENHLSLLQ